MLFPYVFVPHRMDKMQSFIDFIFDEIWCKAPGNGPYGLHLFDAYSELQEVMEAFHYSESKGAKFFASHIELIRGLFSVLTPGDIAQFERWYRGNNNLEKICANDPTAELARYTDIKLQYPTLVDKLKDFFTGLYSPTLLDLAALRDKIGDIDDHYEAFITTNGSGKCPFCGIGDLLGKYESKREAYDHYLPKAMYPFCSINFKNLVPACHHCNSSYKGSKDTAYAPKDPTVGFARRKMFYPFSSASFGIELEVRLGHVDLEKLVPTDIELSFGPDLLGEQIETWKDVYGIEERYRAKLLSCDAKAWALRVLDEWRWHSETGGLQGKEPSSYLRDEMRHASERPYVDSNFLRGAFLRACDEVGLFDP